MMLVMKWKADKTLTAATKALSIFISALLCVGLFTTGLMAAPDCGARCCCGVTPQVGAQHAMPMKIQSPQGCCAGNTPMPCDIQNTQPHELPDALSASSSNLNIPTLDLLVVQIPVESAANTNTQANHSDSINHHFRSPPIYLTNLTILA